MSFGNNGVNEFGYGAGQIDLVKALNPNVLSFTSLDEANNFVFIVDGAMEKAFMLASLIWDCGDFKVRSLVVVYDAREEQDLVPMWPF
jgi:hypothetical protein